MTSKQKGLVIASGLAGKGALDIVLLDLEGVTSFTNVFVIATANSGRHARTLAEAVVEAARGYGDRPLGTEGEETARWILVDLGEVVAHVFTEETRERYSLERLWGEATEIDLPAAAGVAR